MNPSALPPVRQNLSILLTGAVILVLAVMLRQTLHGLVDTVPILAAVSTILVFVVPGVVVGFLAPRRWLANGASLGFLAGCLIALKSAMPSASNLAPLLLVEGAGIFAAVGGIGCSLGALFGGRVLRRLLVLSGGRMERTPHE